LRLKFEALERALPEMRRVARTDLNVKSTLPSY
jgi:hypothetical protein